MWHFWIDVGGTFTDCLAAAPNGDEYSTKILSSGLTKGVVKSRRGSDRFVDTSRIGTVDDFWRGAKINFLSGDGDVLSSAAVIGFTAASGEFAIDHWAVNQTAFDQDSTAPVCYELDTELPAPILTIHMIQGIPIDQDLADCRVDLGTTRGTNALLTRSGAATALVTSSGMQDFLLIGDQARPKLFELDVQKLRPLFQASIEIQERVLVDGTIELAPDRETVATQLKELRAEGIDSIAICFMFGFKFPQHEQLVAEVAQEIGFLNVRASSDVAPLIKIVPRGETTVLDAYLNPVINRYLDEVQSQLSPASRLRFMTSAGGLVSRSRFSGKDAVLSGPAGGVVGAARVAAGVGLDQIIGFDMGGTSTDVSRFDGSFERSFETLKAGVRIVTPMMEVETVAAGGGSVCWFDGSKLQVGPKSAGSNPGPACYGRGGPLAITDINLYLGRIQRSMFPFHLDLESVQQRLQDLCVQLEAAGHKYSAHELAEGFLRIANHNMSAAIQTVSVAKGYDPRDYALVSFGGAGSQHCCAVADNLGMTKILDHPQGSILSAVGVRLADQTAHAVESTAGILTSETMDSLESVFERLSEQATQSLVDEGNNEEQVRIVRSLDLRYAGTETPLSISPHSDSALRDGGYFDLFCERHQQHFGYLQDREIEVVAVRVDATVDGNRVAPVQTSSAFTDQTSSESQLMWDDGQFSPTGIFKRSRLLPGQRIIGPAIVADRHMTTIVDRGWEAKVLPEAILLIEKSNSTSRDSKTGEASQLGSRPDQTETKAADPVQLEIFNNHFSSIARQMGVSLQKTSASVNVKERLDFSCAIFTKTGSLVVNAPHIPVHLGAMSETVRAIIRLNSNVVSGDVFVTNDPYEGGSHLPDVTVITPVFDPLGSELWFWVASRSHHAEIGGSAPGSMPANATCLGEEGVLIQNFRLIEGSGDSECETVARGDSGDLVAARATIKENFDRLRSVLTNAPYPSRSPDENLADIRAQVAANRTGLNQLSDLVAKHSIETVEQYMSFIQNSAEQKIRAVLQQMDDGEFRFEDSLDNGATIRVKLVKHNDQLEIDFDGTDPVLSGNLNANSAIVSSAVMYVMRLLIAEDIPLNEGVMKPVTINLPPCFLNPTPSLNPLESPAIVGGNVETSQRVVDVLLGALSLAAASQGTMNNWLMGNANFGYYETVGGGSGATRFGCGSDGVHTHMTNTRLTDPEILESRYPVVLREFSIRHGSGGAGTHSGGDGMIRDVEFREPVTVSLLTSRRTIPPYGMLGGAPGTTGLNQLTRKAAIGEPTKIENLPSRCEFQAAEGDRLRLETPGGGGWGSPGKSDS